MLFFQNLVAQFDLSERDKKIEENKTLPGKDPGNEKSEIRNLPAGR
jgi:hypothetical protein